MRVADWVRTHAPGSAPFVVVDRGPAARAYRNRITAEITGTVDARGVWFVPRDPRVERAVWGAGLPTRGPFTRAVDAVHAALDADARHRTPRAGGVAA